MSHLSFLAQNVQSWHWLRSLKMDSIDEEHHIVQEHSQIPILTPQNSCQQPRSRTPETSLCHRNRYLHHTCLIFSHPNISFPSRPATITLEWVLKRGCQHPSDKFEILWQVAQNSFSLYMPVLVKNLTNNCESNYLSTHVFYVHTELVKWFV